MTHSLKSQIEAIQEARTFIKFVCENNTLSIAPTPTIDARLNDAGSTIAALNLNPSRESNAKLIGIVNPDQSRDEYSQRLVDLVADFLEGKPEKEKEFLAMTYDRINELEIRHSKLQQAYSQYIFFMDGYRNGSASISEVNAAQSEFLILLNGNDN